MYSSSCNFGEEINIGGEKRKSKRVEEKERKNTEKIREGENKAILKKRKEKLRNVFPFLGPKLPFESYSNNGIVGLFWVTIHFILFYFSRFLSKKNFILK